MEQSGWCFSDFMQQYKFQNVSIALESFRLSIVTDKNFCKESLVSGKTVFHRHPYIEVLVPVRGSLTFYTDDQNSVPISIGSALLVKPSQQHCVQRESASAYFCFGFTWKDAEDGSMARYLGQTLANCEYLTVPVSKTDMDLLCELPTDLSVSNPAMFYVVRTKLALVILNLLSRLPSPEESVPMPESGSSESPMLRSYQVDKWLSANYCSPDISLKSISQTLFISPRQVNNIVQKWYGQSFWQRVISMRMTLAARLLRDGVSSVEEIASQVGYRSVTAFYHMFRNYFGITPGEFCERLDKDGDVVLTPRPKKR